MTVDLILELCCISFCFLHLLIGLINGILQKKKLDHICEKCISPVYEGEEHNCILSDKQLKKLSSFIKSVAGTEYIALTEEQQLKMVDFVNEVKNGD